MVVTVVTSYLCWIHSSISFHRPTWRGIAFKSNLPAALQDRIIHCRQSMFRSLKAVWCNGAILKCFQKPNTEHFGMEGQETRHERTLKGLVGLGASTDHLPKSTNTACWISAQHLSKQKSHIPRRILMPQDLLGYLNHQPPATHSCPHLQEHDWEIPTSNDLMVVRPYRFGSPQVFSRRFGTSRGSKTL